MTRIIRFTGFMLYSFQWCYLTIAPTKNSRVYIECAIFNKRFLGEKNTHFKRTFRAFEEFVYMQITGLLYGFFFLSFNSLSLKSQLIELFYEKIWFIPNIFKWDVSNRYRLFPPHFRICKFFSSSSLCRMHNGMTCFCLFWWNTILKFLKSTKKKIILTRPELCMYNTREKCCYFHNNSLW